MSRTFEQFVRFTTDAAGLERTFRLFQALAQILSSYTLPFQCLLFLLSLLPSSPSSSSLDGSDGTSKAVVDAATTHAVLLGLRAQLALARRYFRLFRFLESFQAAQRLYHSLSLPPPPPGRGRGRRETAAVWVDVLGRTFNGMYLLLEASTIADAQRVPGLALWGPAREPTVAVEGQRFWLLSLVCGVLAGCLRIADVVLGPEGGGAGRRDGKAGTEEDVGGAGADEKVAPAAGGKGEGMGKGKGETDADVRRRREARSVVAALGRRVVSDALDITLPGSVVGWVPASAGTVGVAMFVTTILTSVDIWERCGREVAAGGK
ncbi:putative ex11b-like protein [Rosellinia necatrix]|uniref:Putative ex11b-like protein n=1 Tax=Rosellinia necatrix TaxID=77044 RepID=A0A1S8A8D3_ROSNE|nr:putative ex11b-like protein [Rosellinia necatrix]